MNVLVFALKIFSSLGQLDVNKLSHFDEFSGTPIYDLQTDQMGNLWIGTQNGLLKFDGYDYTRFHPDPDDSTTIGELLAYSIVEDQKGYLWIGCQSAIYRYNPKYKSFKQYRYDHLIDMEKFLMAGIATISPDHKGRLYFGITSFDGNNGSNALIYYDENEDAMKSYDYPDTINLASVYRSATDTDGNIWFLDFSGVYKIDTARKITRIPVPTNVVISENEFVNGITIDSSGTIWLSSTESKLYAYDTGKRTARSWSVNPLFDDSFNDVYMMDLLVGPDGNIWMTSQNGLIMFDRSTESFKSFDPGSEDKLLRDPVRALHFDSFGNLWIGTESIGLLNYGNKTVLNSFVWDNNDKTTITTGWVHKIIESSDGSIWIATRGNNLVSGLNKMDPAKGTIEPMPYYTITPGIVWYEIMAEITPGNILFSSNQGYKIFNYHENQLRDTAFAWLPDTIGIMNTVTDSRSIVWFCSYNGLYGFDSKRNSSWHYNLTSFSKTLPASNVVTHVYESPIHGLWIMTNWGLFLFDYETGQVKRHAYDPTYGDVLSSQDINSFYEDPEGIAWVGTWQGGLNRYDPRSGKIKKYAIKDGLPSMSIQGILADEKNDALWLSTFQGISRLNIQEEQFTNFTLSDGIQGLLYADGVFLKTSGNLFIFGGSNGITYFNPDHVLKNSTTPKVYITGFKVADQSMSIDPLAMDEKVGLESFTLAHHQNNISIEYTGIQYDNPSKNKFACRLVNYDEKWREVGNIRSAFYYNLPPGDYTFKIKAANSNGVWNEEGASVSFMITPPWWKNWWAYLVYGLLVFAIIILVDRIQRRRLIEKERAMARDTELAQAKEIEKAYKELKTTQTQLIHSEKMASLGELTAGIAHEIQNPLNFVNNFSEVSVDLIREMNDEMEKGNVDEVQSITGDLQQNLDKISHHGKRASSIVKGMLEHSRASAGQKELTNINVLADEYLRLAYHGLRAKDKTFNADFKTNFDESLPKINVIPQDLARVILNLINNAFYSVSERARLGEVNYKPTVLVSTKKLDQSIEMRIKDNGNGIPASVKEKIFQPFFTTKPTGQGTGLGLSLSFDIITNGHGGELKVETKEGEGTEFIISLPL